VPRLLRNDVVGGNWLSLVLQSSQAGNRRGLGARIDIDTGNRTFHRQLHGGGSYLAGRPARIHIGLGTAVQAQVTVRWPDGGVDQWSLSAGTHLLIQGSAHF
jgi:hypothetical protein